MPLTKIQSRGTENVGQGSSNVIINGAMNVAQRGASFTGLGGSTGAVYNLDRFCTYDQATAGRATITQDSSAPSGFANSLKVACTTADTSIASTEQFLLQQRIEGQNLQAFAKGTSDAKEFAVSFYVKGNASATYICELHDQDNGRQCSKTFNVTTDWTRIELIFPADTTGAFDDDNDRSLNFNIALHAGSTLTSGTLNSNAFATTTQANRYVGGSSFFDSTSRTFFITGVQIEVGSQVSDFQHESFDETLIKCQRYYQLVGRDFSDATPTTAFGWGYTTSGSNAEGMFRFERRMREKPTFTASADGNLDFQTNTGSGAVNTSGNAFTSAVTSETSAEYTQQNYSSNFGGAGQPYFLKWNGVQSSGITASVQLDAEL